MQEQEKAVEGPEKIKEDDMNTTIVATSAIVISVLALAGILNMVILDAGPDYPVPDLDDRSSTSSYRGGKTKRAKRI